MYYRTRMTQDTQTDTDFIYIVSVTLRPVRVIGVR